MLCWGKKDDTEEQASGSEFLTFIETLAKEHRSVKTSPWPSVQAHTVLQGPRDDEAAENPVPYCSARSTSTYPYLKSGKRDGEPICDVYHTELFDDRALIVVADGCGWGPKPKTAATNAVNAAVQFVHEQAPGAKTVRELAMMLLGALDRAHYAIITQKENLWQVGTTTLQVALVVPLPQQPGITQSMGVVVASVGDCKCFVHSPSRKISVDITHGNRPNSSDATDCGGRIGPQLDDGEPDLRNLKVWFQELHEGDLLVAASDGVHDNLDPQYMGLTPAQSGGSGDHWDGMPFNDSELLRSQFRANKIGEFAVQAELKPADLVTALIQHAATLTQPSRDFMKEHTGKRLPVDYTRFPGKMDHSTCVVLRIQPSFSK